MAAAIRGVRRHWLQRFAFCVGADGRTSANVAQFCLCRGRLFSRAQSRFFFGGIVLWVAAIRALCRPVCALDSQTITDLPAPRRKSTNATTKRNRSYDQSAPHILSSLEIWHRRAFRIKFNNFLYGKARRSARHTRVARRQTNIDLKQIVLASSGEFTNP